MRGALVGLSWLLIVGCTPAPADTGPELPAADTGAPDAPGDQEFPLDSGDTGPHDQVPEHLLTLAQWGRWDLSPFGGPYSALVGQLAVQEYLDGVRPSEDTGDTDVVVLDCDLAYNLVGVPSARACPGCEFTFDVTFYRLSGDDGGCRDPERPRDGEVRTLGFDAASGAIYLDHSGTGVWVRWYDAEQRENRVDFRWERTVAVTVDEEGP